MPASAPPPGSFCPAPDKATPPLCFRRRASPSRPNSPPPRHCLSIPSVDSSTTTLHCFPASHPGSLTDGRNRRRQDKSSSTGRVSELRLHRQASSTLVARGRAPPPGGHGRAAEIDVGAVRRRKRAVRRRSPARAGGADRAAQGSLLPGPVLGLRRAGSVDPLRPPSDWARGRGGRAASAAVTHFYRPASRPP
ncbi:hypothetical protein PVAP13_1KG164937 [Panicum virgatum]|uniref:Uncharacterized protein n=1 Tax=Panicum virgatum TaxID=38727 RepID=A0A8T0XDR9_PANVG|nr:hypothetical protein PVAP13_1KG164937 [Panicum virgatum]